MFCTCYPTVIQEDKEYVKVHNRLILFRKLLKDLATIIRISQLNEEEKEDLVNLRNLIRDKRNKYIRVSFSSPKLKLRGIVVLPGECTTACPYYFFCQAQWQEKCESKDFPTVEGSLYFAAFFNFWNYEPPASVRGKAIEGADIG
jgi:hypothetical protein